MTDHITAMQQALEALLCARDITSEVLGADVDHIDTAITSLRAALAQQQGEPVAWQYQKEGGGVFVSDQCPQDVEVWNDIEWSRPLYTAPRPAPAAAPDAAVAELAWLEGWLQYADECVGVECCGHGVRGECCGNPDPVRRSPAEVIESMARRHRLLTEMLAARPAAPTVTERGPWDTGTTDDGRTFIQSDDFTHDVRLYVDGDFEGRDQAARYAEEIARRLNAAPAAKREPLTDEPVDMALCESHRLVLRIGQPYVFRPVAGCETCERMAAASREAYGIGGEA